MSVFNEEMSPSSSEVDIGAPNNTSIIGPLIVLVVVCSFINTTATIIVGGILCVMGASKLKFFAIKGSVQYYFVVAFIISVASLILNQTFPKQLDNYVFLFLVMNIAYSYFRSVPLNVVRKYFRIMAVISLLIADTSFTLTFWGTPIASLMTETQRVGSSAFFLGNQACSFLAILCFCMIDTKLAYVFVYFANATLLSIVCSSRGALIGNLFFVAWFIIRLSIYKKRPFSGMLAIVMVAVGFAYLVHSNLYIIQRFNAMNDQDPGSAARIEAWSYAWPAFSHNILGYGAGNAVDAISDISGIDFTPELPAMHNIFIQAFLDFGVIGGSLWLYILISLIVKNFRQVLSEGVYAAFLAYCIIGMLRFSLAEVLPFILLAACRVIAPKEVDHAKINIPS